MTERHRKKEERLLQAEQFIDALRSEEVDAVVGKEHVLLLRLKETEDTLRRTEGRYRGIVETQTEMICRRSPDGAIAFVNEAYCRFFGKSRKDLLGRTFDPPVYEDDRSVVARALTALGPDRPRVDIECRIMAEGALHWTRWTLQAFFDEAGQMDEIQAVGRDVTEQKRAEQALQSAHLELAEANRKLEAAYREVYEYSEAVTHDINGVLRAVSNYADFLYEDLSESLTGDQRLYLENLKRAARTGGALIKELRDLAKVGKYAEAPEAIDFAGMLNDLTALHGAGKQIAFALADAWPDMDAPPSLLRLILGNLISNAVKFSPPDTGRIEAGWREPTPGRIELFVRDNGIGIDPRHHERIFQIFKRLHPAGEYEGSGMGLAIVKKAARYLGGAVRLESAPGKGSTFFVDLPWSKNPTEA